MKAGGNPPQDSTDAYLDWALATDFRYVLRKSGNDAFGGTEPIGLLIEWLSVEAATAAVDIVKELKLHVPALYGGSNESKVRRVWSMSVPARRVAELLDATKKLVMQVELAAPLTGTGPINEDFRARYRQSDQEILAAVLDDGCAFANSRFLQADQTRILWLWNQDKEAVGAPLTHVFGPTPNCDFGYGGQFGQTDLQHLIDGANGQQDVVYERVGLRGLRRSAAHGPHVMDKLCGAEDWQIAFVQFPQAGIDDPSGRWLARYALDGLHYVLECAGANTRKVVVNISWGPQTGPHDGSSVLERAIDHLVDEQRALNRELIVALPAGNTFGARAHAQIDNCAGGAVHWVVPPDGRTPAFLEVWWPRGVEPCDVRLRITPPSGAAVVIRFGKRWRQKTWFAKLKKVGCSTMALVIVHPTEEGDAKWRGRHGVWTIEVLPTQSAIDGVADVYVARANHNMGARRRARASFLTDAALEAGRFVQPDQRMDEVLGSAVRRSGSLNGLATGEKTFVAASYQFSDFASSPYSSSGGSRGSRGAPDYACVGDHSAAAVGVRATGVRSGTRVRLVGTSTASPQLGRKLANEDRAVFSPLPPVPESALRIGAGRLWPDEPIV